MKNAARSRCWLIRMSRVREGSIPGWPQRRVWVGGRGIQISRPETTNEVLWQGWPLSSLSTYARRVKMRRPFVAKATRPF